MNEEQTILEFFSQTENLSLALAVAERMDAIRERMNNQLWQQVQLRIDELLAGQNINWHVRLTEDRNVAGRFVGLHYRSTDEQQICLLPMLEQQFMGSEWRIYSGLMWSATPSTAHIQLPAITHLQSSLQQAGYKSNENFLCWQWTPYYPRRRSFLLSYSQKPAELLGEIAKIAGSLLIDYGSQILHANKALGKIAPSLPAALQQMRGELLG